MQVRKLLQYIRIAGAKINEVIQILSDHDFIYPITL